MSTSAFRSKRNAITAIGEEINKKVKPIAVSDFGVRDN
jgi:hypothetical protein